MNQYRQKLSALRVNPILTPVLLALCAAGAGALSLWFSSVDNRTAMFFSYFANPRIALLNIFPVVVLALLLYFLTGRAGMSYGITAGVIAGLTAGNFFKLTFRNDPLMFEDLFLLREAGSMAGQYQLFLNRSMVLALALLVLGWAFLHWVARARTPWRPRLLCALAVVLMAAPLVPLYGDDTLYIQKTRNEDLISPWSATQVYTSKGFLYPFFYSVTSASDTPPEGYSSKAAETHLAAFPEEDIPEGEKVDFFAIQLEAYNDFSRFHVPGLNPSVYETFHALEEEGYSGNLITNIFAGGTVDTERCFLTGFSQLGSFRRPTNSYVRYFADQGYYTQGSHPCYAWFYNRENINANLGFENYWFVENRYGEMTGGGVGYDELLFPDIIELYEEHKDTDERPYFSFNVTYQGHGPYDSDQLWWGDGYVSDEGYSQADRNVLNNYFGSLKDTGDRLAEFFDYFRASEEPVVIVLFGDHNPWLGDDNRLYSLLDINLDISEREGFLNYYGTRYLIWANDAARAALGNDFRGEGPDLSPNFLMNEVFGLCGWGGPSYLQATNQTAAVLPVVNSATGLYIEHGTLAEELTPEGQALAADYRNLQYYWRKHFRA